MQMNMKLRIKWEGREESSAIALKTPPAFKPDTRTPTWIRSALRMLCHLRYCNWNALVIQFVFFFESLPDQGYEDLKTFLISSCCTFSPIHLLTSLKWFLRGLGWPSSWLLDFIRVILQDRSFL
jgi:hypothetical protein